jgi:membrane protease YdiL (CAAX protease family)
VLKTREEPPFWGYSDLVAFAGMFVAAAIVAVLGTALIAIAGSSLYDANRSTKLATETLGSPLVALLVQMMLYLIVLLLLALLFWRRYDRPLFASLGWRSLPAGHLILIGALAPCALLTTNSVILLLKPPEIKNPFEKFLQDPSTAVVLIVFAVFLGPAFEELIFRGFLFPLLRRDLGVPLALLISSALFAGIHAAQYPAWQILLGLTLTGCVFGLVRHVSGSTFGSWVMHAGYNLTAIAGRFAYEHWKG